MKTLIPFAAVAITTSCFASFASAAESNAIAAGDASRGQAFDVQVEPSKAADQGQIATGAEERLASGQSGKWLATSSDNKMLTAEPSRITSAITPAKAGLTADSVEKQSLSDDAFAGLKPTNINAYGKLESDGGSDRSLGATTSSLGKIGADEFLRPGN